MGKQEIRNDDKLMKMLAEEEVERLAAEFDRIEQVPVDSSKLDDWFDSFMEEREQEAEVKPFPGQNHFSFGRYRRVAAIVVVFLVIGSAFTLSSEALRLRVLNIFTESTEEYTNIELHENSDLMKYIRENWQGSYYPSLIPEGYELVDVNDINDNKMMIFGYQNESLIFTQESERSHASIDTEDADAEQILIHGQSAIFVQKDGENSLTWFDVTGNALYLSASNIERQDLVEIAENLKVIE